MVGIVLPYRVRPELQPNPGRFTRSRKTSVKSPGFSLRFSMPSFKILMGGKGVSTLNLTNDAHSCEIRDKEGSGFHLSSRPAVKSGFENYDRERFTQHLCGQNIPGALDVVSPSKDIPVAEDPRDPDGVYHSDPADMRRCKCPKDHQVMCQEGSALMFESTFAPAGRESWELSNFQREGLRVGDGSRWLNKEVDANKYGWIFKMGTVVRTMIKKPRQSVLYVWNNKVLTAEKAGLMHKLMGRKIPAQDEIQAGELGVVRELLIFGVTVQFAKARADYFYHQLRREPELRGFHGEAAKDRKGKRARKLELESQVMPNGDVFTVGDQIKFWSAEETMFLDIPGKAWSDVEARAKKSFMSAHVARVNPISISLVEQQYPVTVWTTTPADRVLYLLGTQKKPAGYWIAKKESQSKLHYIDPQTPLPLLGCGCLAVPGGLEKVGYMTWEFDPRLKGAEDQADVDANATCVGKEKVMCPEGDIWIVQDGKDSKELQAYKREGCKCRMVPWSAEKLIAYYEADVKAKGKELRSKARKDKNGRPCEDGQILKSLLEPDEKVQPSL